MRNEGSDAKGEMAACRWLTSLWPAIGREVQRANMAAVQRVHKVLLTRRLIARVLQSFEGTVQLSMPTQYRLPPSQIINAAPLAPPSYSIHCNSKTHAAWV